jgi:hypothetical protein
MPQLGKTGDGHASPAVDARVSPCPPTLPRVTMKVRGGLLHVSPVAGRDHGAVVSTVTGVDGTFELTDAPVGTQVPLVLQVGKWQREVAIDVEACEDNRQPDRSLSLPGTLVGAGPNDSMPDIAVSTGASDTLECLMLRLGIPRASTSPVPAPRGTCTCSPGARLSRRT